MLRSFALGHYLFLEAHSFSQAMISEKDYVHGQNIVVYLCARLRVLFIDNPSNIFTRMRLV